MLHSFFCLVYHRQVNRSVKSINRLTLHEIIIKSLRYNQKVNCCLILTETVTVALICAF